ncbi:MAG TPA: hypothetical protein VJA94_25225 [Candidatus Angelobacter sp.]
MALVLCTGADLALMKTRKLLLERAGHQVFTLMNEGSLQEACNAHKFDVVVIGQSTSRQIKTRLLTMVREYCPKARVLELYSVSTGKLLDAADAWLEVPADIPADLSTKVTALAGQRAKSAN